MSLIIGLSGQKQSGKDTTAKHLKSTALHQSMNYYQLSFAKPLKELVALLTGYTMNQIEGLDPEFNRESSLMEFGGLSIRQILQMFGTDFCRNELSKNIWIDRLQDKLKHYEEDSNAEVDANIVMNGRGEFIEVQCTSEKKGLSRDNLDTLIYLSVRGIEQIHLLQKEALLEF